MPAIELYSTPLFNDSSLISYKRFNGNSVDSKNTSYNGTDTSMAYGSSYGVFGSGAYFSGSSYFAFSTSGAMANLSTDWTISYWAKPVDTTNLRVVISLQGTDFGDSGNIFGYNCGNIYSGGVVTPGYASVTATIDANWHLYTFTLSGGVTLSVYKDGVFVQSANRSPANSTPLGTNTAYIGALNPSYYRYQGYLDDLAIFSRALTADEIYKLYTGNWAKNQFFFNAL